MKLSGLPCSEPVAHWCLHRSGMRATPSSVPSWKTSACVAALRVWLHLCISSLACFPTPRPFVLVESPSFCSLVSLAFVPSFDAPVALTCTQASMRTSLCCSVAAQLLGGTREIPYLVAVLLFHLQEELR